jgi:hypothetical protein
MMDRMNRPITQKAVKVTLDLDVFAVALELTELKHRSFRGKLEVNMDGSGRIGTVKI